ncbi:MAG: phytoene desaturase family protein [Nocardioides sp.]
MRVVVVGGGLGGLASALRLAKLGHDVTLVERTASLGGALTFETADGFAWDRGAHGTLLPAVLRDLFRKSGRPLEKELELEPVEVIRHHRFEDGTEIRLPGASRARQTEAFDDLGAGLGTEWADHVASYADVWETLRRHYLEVPWTPEALPADTVRAVMRLVDGRDTLHRRLRRDFSDARLRLVAGHRFVAEGHDLRNVPAWLGLHSYLEQRFGGWTVAGGFARLTDALVARLGTRGVTVLTSTPVTDLVVRDGRCVGVATTTGTLDADAAVCAVDPRRLPALASYVARSMPAIPPVTTHLGLAGDVPDVGHELVIHGDPMLVIRGGGRAPSGHTAWTMHGRGKIAEDMLLALARHGIDVRDRVAVRVDRSPLVQVEETGSAMGVLWQGRGTVRQRLGPTTPVRGVYAAGAHAAPGGQVPFVGLSAALVAQAIGPA